MSKLSKATDFYLRGFPSSYIKRRTGISVQSLLKQLLAQGTVYTKDDITAYQIEYIRKRYSQDEIKEAYIQISRKYPDLYKAGHAKKIECLGCGFGNHARVFRALLGDVIYDALKSQCWHEKQSASVRQKYGADNVFCKGVFETVVSPEALAEGRAKRTETMLARYGVEQPNQNEAVKQRMRETYVRTHRERYGVDNPTQRPEVAKRVSQSRQQTMLARYGAPNSVQVKAIRDKIFEARKANGTLNSSKPEDMLYQLLVDRFGADDVFRNHFVDSRYPWHVDFYIKSLDLFIELNGDRCHNTHWFDADSVSDRQTRDAWIENAERTEAETGKSSRYRKYVATWTETDVAKREAARTHDLNYLVFWDGSSKNGIPCLCDANAWFRDGCPMPSEWHAENTY